MRVLKCWNSMPREAVDLDIQNQVWRGSEQNHLVEDAPADCRWVGLDEL